MPSKSKKQRRFMAAAAHNKDFARRAGISQTVAREFHAADKRRGYAAGGLAQALGAPARSVMPQGTPGKVPNGALRTADDALRRSERAVQAIRNRSLRGRLMARGGKVRKK